jgi:hypothetical protein
VLLSTERAKHTHASYAIHATSPRCSLSTLSLPPLDLGRMFYAMSEIPRPTVEAARMWSSCGPCSGPITHQPPSP